MPRTKSKIFVWGAEAIYFLRLLRSLCSLAMTLFQQSRIFCLTSSTLDVRVLICFAEQLSRSASQDLIGEISL